MPTHRAFVVLFITVIGPGNGSPTTTNVVVVLVGVLVFIRFSVSQPIAIKLLIGLLIIGDNIPDFRTVSDF